MDRNLRFLGWLTLVGLAWATAFAEPIEHSPHLGLLAERIVLAEDDTPSLRIDAAAYERLRSRGAAIVARFPLPERGEVDLHVGAFSVIAPGARFVVADGPVEREVPPPDIRSFRGVVAGEPDSTVSLSLFEGRIAGFVRIDGDTFVFGPQQFDPARAGANEIRVRRAAPQPLAPGEARCAVDEQPETGFAPAGGPIAGDTLLRARIAFDATVEWYEHFGSLVAAQTYILSLMADVSTIYADEVDVLLEVPYLRVFASEPDPYTDDETTSFDLLHEMRDEWNANQTTVERTTAHLLSVSGGNGHAFIDVLCDNDIVPGSSLDYAATVLTGNGSFWERELVAHELGHNFASPHTHCYAPEIDRCANEGGCYQGSTQQVVGTIMSYCNQTDTVFHPRVEDERIRPAAEAAYPACVEIAGDPGRLREATGDGLALSVAAQCPGQLLQNDDGVYNNVFGVGGMNQGAFIKRFTPSCYPFNLTRIDAITGASPTIAVGRPIRLLVFTDPSGSGDPAQASLVYTEDTTIQVHDYFTFNEYVLASPVALGSGDYYIGYYDLVGDPQQTTIGVSDNSTSGDSYRALDSLSPENFTLFTGGTWMIRGHGGSVGDTGVIMSWGQPCNIAEVPAQDFGVYRGDLEDFASAAPLTCTTAGNPSYIAVGAPGDAFFIVVPQSVTREGSYGQATAGEREPATAACRPQRIGDCP